MTGDGVAMAEFQIELLAGVGGMAVGVWLGLGRRARAAGRVRRMLGLTVSPGGAVPRLKARVVGRHSLQARWLVPELLLLPIGLAFGKATGSPVPLIAAATGAVPLRRWRLRRRVAAEARRRATAVIDLCAGLAAELRSGATPDQALDEVTARTTSLRAGLGDESVARLSAGRYGADVPAALRAIADLPGGRGAAAVAACWRVTAESGTGLAAGLDQLADALRAERALTEEIAGELAAPRATIAVLAALPLIGLLLGGALGAEPVQVLLHTPAGLACLTVGALLEAAGLEWTARIVRGAADSPDERPRGRAPAACGLSRINAGRREVAW